MFSEPSSADTAFMEQALTLAGRAGELGEIPVGAIAVREGLVVGRGYNRREVDKDPFAHAELIALRQAAANLDAWRLVNVVLYVTLEPCAMCCGAAVSARLARVVYGAADPKAGAAQSLYRLLDDRRLNHRAMVTAGVLQQECGAILSEFFQRRR